MPRPQMMVSFSCGIASAVTTKLCLQKYKDTHDIHIVRFYVPDEHPDSERFMADCEKWFGRQVTVLPTKWADYFEIFSHRQVIVLRQGPRLYAPCTEEYKQKPAQRYARANGIDTQCLGYDSGEQVRADRIQKMQIEYNFIFPLIDEGLSKADCHALLERAGIRRPAMYDLGFKCNNCIGCVKISPRHWNLVRHRFPERFERMAKFERAFTDKKGWEQGAILRIDPKLGRAPWLDELPERPPEPDDERPECGMFCQLTDADYGISGGANA